MKNFKLLAFSILSCLMLFSTSASAQNAFTQDLTYESSQESFRWQVSSWGDCDCSIGQKSRTVQCVDSLSNIVGDASCGAYDKPADVRDCSSSCGACPIVPTCASGGSPLVFDQDGVPVANPSTIPLGGVIPGDGRCPIFQCPNAGCPPLPTCNAKSQNMVLESSYNLSNNDVCNSFICEGKWCAADQGLINACKADPNSIVVKTGGKDLDGCHIYECHTKDESLCPSPTCTADEIEAKSYTIVTSGNNSCYQKQCYDSAIYELKPNGHPKKIVTVIPNDSGTTITCPAAPACATGSAVSVGTSVNGCYQYECQFVGCAPAPSCPGGSPANDLGTTDINGCTNYSC